MSVEHIKGDLLTFPHGITVAAHCANCRCTLGNDTATGIAGAIGKLYPAAATADKQAFDEGNARLGLLSVAQIEGGRRIVNLYGQDSFGRDRRHLDYEGLYSAMERLRDLLDDAHKEGRAYTLGLPYLMGCNRAGGAWVIVETMIQHLWAGSPTRCLIVEKTDSIHL